VARRLADVTGILLSVVVAAGTWLYVAGIQPPFPWSVWAFNGLFAVCVVLALWFGR
jgi:hypothetical protein